MKSMNVFDEALATGRIVEVRDLKILFWTLAKKLHPDSAAFPAGEQAFIKLKRDFDDAVRTLARAEAARAAAPADQPWAAHHAPASHPAASTAHSAASAAHLATSAGPGDFQKCAGLFSDLIASNFPMARREGNKRYAERILELNRELGLFGMVDLFLECERELLEIRGDSIVLNHAFNLVRLYLYNLSDYIGTGNYFSKIYLAQARQSVMTCLAGHDARGTVRLIGWFLAGLAS